METWGYCQPCTRWFYCPQWFEKSAPEPTCPVCGAAPTAIENRRPVSEPQREPRGTREGAVPRGGTAAASMEPTRIRGLCPKCGDWFGCDDWFDQSVPLPCCPRCRLAPARLRYEGAPATGTHSYTFEVGVGMSEQWIG